MSKFRNLLAGLILFATPVFAGNPIAVPPEFEPKLDPIDTSIVVTCQSQLVFVAIVFADGKVTIYDQDSGVPSDTALYTANKAKHIEGREICVNPGSTTPPVKL